MNASRRRVAIIFHRLGPYHIARLRAAARRMEVVAVEESAETSDYAWDEVAAPDGDGFSRVTMLGRGERPAQPAREIARRLRASLDGCRPDAVAVPGWSDPAALAALGWGAERGVPVILMSESTAHDSPRRAAWREWVKRRVVRLGAAGLVGGDPHADYLVALGMPRALILPGYDAVDNEHFAAGAEAARAKAVETRIQMGLPERYFLASNRFLPQKNLPALLRAFADYRGESRSRGLAAWDLVLLGDGPGRSEVSALRAELGLEDAVHLPGFRQYRELPAFYGLAGAFVHAATSEPWGLVVNEALAAGLPVVVSNRCGCAPGLVRDGENGFLFDPTNAGALTSLLLRVASSSSETLAFWGEAGRRLVAVWGPETFGENLGRAVELALAAPRPRCGPMDRGLLAALIRRADADAALMLPTPTAGASAPTR